MTNPKFIVFIAAITYLFQKSNALIQNGPKGKITSRNYQTPPERDSQITKVSLTQNGYIQFLKYINEVPPMTEYTFCLWIRSNNLTHNHPILSYSKQEEERLIRVWIGSNGNNINLELLGNTVFEFPFNMVENRWYHICQSWSSHQGVWMIYVNGKMKSSGSYQKLRGNFIKGGGDIVVGQEYTDFDKGLDDGIEGDIFGFNFVLSAASGSLKYPQNLPSRRKFQVASIPKYPQFFAAKPQQSNPFGVEQVEEYKTIVEDQLPDAQTYGMDPNRRPKGFLDAFRRFFGEEPAANVRVVKKYPRIVNKGPSRRVTDRVSANDINDVKKSLGLLLVELSFDCGYKKGAPLSGKNVLVNWNQSPVRVFGGAILKTVPAFCYGH
ncbi:unnamed protein product [Phyllotreta striolata]|uniref:Pentraxin (PTX) domain-containing protein n=1 Tax=Phyllotreta striolata TaxID=444603 RepID=A0A9N9XLU5_PHYSR|nr:unnamed protein product [Phyllotreta striolata]